MHARAECVQGRFDFVVSRAVAPLQTLYGWTRHLVSVESKNEIPNGWLVLKGGNLEMELSLLKKKAKLTAVNDFFEESFFTGKFILYF